MEKIKRFIVKLNEYGVPLPMLRVDGKASLTATFAFLSFNTAFLGQLGKISGFVGTVDLSQANALFIISLGAYLGRKLQGDGKQITLNSEKSDRNE